MSSFSEKQRKFKEKAAQEAIYEATIRLISEQGGDGLTMQDIATSAGIATGTLYNYFQNKEDLLYFVHGRLHNLIMQQIVEVTQSEWTPVEKLESFVLRLLSFCAEYHSVFDLAERFGVKERIPVEKKTDDIEQVYQCLTSILDAGVEQRCFRAVDTRTTAEIFFAQVIGTMHIHNWFDRCRPQCDTDKIMQFFLHYLKGN